MTNPITHLHRAARAKGALTVVSEETYSDTSIDRMNPEDLRDAIADLISDLLHLAGYARLDPLHILNQARTNFLAEAGEA